MMRRTVGYRMMSYTHHNFILMRQKK